MNPYIDKIIHKIFLIFYFKLFPSNPTWGEGGRGWITFLQNEAFDVMLFLGKKLIFSTPFEDKVEIFGEDSSNHQTSILQLRTLYMIRTNTYIVYNEINFVIYWHNWPPLPTHIIVMSQMCWKICSDSRLLIKSSCINI